MRPAPFAKTKTGRPRGSVDRHASLRSAESKKACAERAAWVGPAIQAAREAAEVSAEELAARIGRTPWMVYRYEKGRSIPPLPTIVAIAAALGVRVSSLFEEVDL